MNQIAHEAIVAQVKKRRGHSACEGCLVCTVIESTVRDVWELQQ